MSSHAFWFIRRVIDTWDPLLLIVERPVSRHQRSLQRRACAVVDRSTPRRVVCAIPPIALRLARCRPHARGH